LIKYGDSMKKGILVFFLILSVSFAGAERYYVHSDNAGLKAMLNVRNEFEGRFSAEMNERQLGLLRILGVQIEPVALYYLDQKPSNPGKPPKDDGRTCLPSEQIPWGVARVYNSVTTPTGGSGIKVAVLDTGAYTGHPDLKNNIIRCVDATRKGGIKNGCSDGHGHGTHVAGTIAANSGADGQGIYGVAPDAQLIIVKVCGNSGMCWGDDIAKGINYATSQGANIISLSLGGSSMSSGEKSAIDNAVQNDVLVIAAAGNNGPNLDTIGYPAAYLKVVAVAATDSSDRVADFSSRGIYSEPETTEILERMVEVAAPGVGIVSTFSDGCYRTMSGTSMATPHVSGLAAKLWQDNAQATRQHLVQQAFDITLGDHAAIGYDAASGFGLPTVQ
jgi:subtilisin